MTTYSLTWTTYAKAWSALTINPDRARQFRAVALRLCAPAAKAQYLQVEKLTGVPWEMVAVIHERESSQNWNTQLAQGDPLHSRSTHVPKGSGPFATWVDGAVWALKREGFDKVIDWRIEKKLYYLEEYNGEGYHARGIPSPYVFAGTNQYSIGKFIGDGVFSAGTVDQQLGCAGMLLAMSQIDDTIKFVRETPVGAPEPKVTVPVTGTVPAPLPTPKPVPSPAPALSLFARLLKLFGG